MTNPLPQQIEPMLPWASRVIPPEAGWAFEVKHDGFRALVFCDRERVRVQSRSLKVMTGFYPELQALKEVLGCRQVVLDGELVAYDEEGRPSFEKMQARAGMLEEEGIFRRLRRRRRPPVPISYQVFDLLYLDGRSVCHRPYRERRQLLLELGLRGDHWITPTHHEGPGAVELLAATRAAGLEGLVAKRLDSLYRPGQRSDDWLKIKNWCRQEFVIGGWREDREQGAGGWLGCLLLGYYHQGQLLYAGGVELGFSESALDILAQVLPTLPQSSSPFAQRQPRRPFQSLQPWLVAEVQFLGWSGQGAVRQAAFKGFVLDRDPRQVGREE